MATPLKDQNAKIVRMQWFLALGLILFALLFYTFRYRTLDRQLTEVDERIGEQERELAASRLRSENLPRIAADNEQLALQLARSKKLPRQQEWAELVRDITRLSNQASLSKRFSYKYGLARRNDLYSETPVMLEFDGDMTNVLAFLRQVEELQRLTRLRSISIKGRTDRPGMVDVKMSLSTYFSTDD